jgi:hypothetical protein
MLGTIVVTYVSSNLFMVSYFTVLLNGYWPMLPVAKIFYGIIAS